MRRKLFTFTFVFILLSLGSFRICAEANDYKGLEPGRSTRSDVEQTLGQAVREISATLSEYKSDKETEKIFVQYRRSSNTVERIEILYSKPIERSVLIASLSLSPTPTASQVNSKGKLEEYFAAKNVVLTYSSGEPGLVSRLGSYSPELFEKSVPKSGAKSDEKGLGPNQEGMGFVEGGATRLTYYPSPSVAACRADCEKNSNCMAFGWVKPGFFNPGDSAMCYLFSSWTKLVEQACCISAVKPH
jgi:hypothetical protein